jgi:hypothetical protein
LSHAGELLLFGRDITQWTPFAGSVFHTGAWDPLGQVRGSYRWVEDRLGRRLAGHFAAGTGLTRSDCPGDFDPFECFGVATLRGRSVDLSIPGVGRSRVRLSGQASPSLPDVRFEATDPPVLAMTASELCEALRFAVADALEEAARPELAEVARAAAVALNGRPKDRRWSDPVPLRPEEGGGA